ncbi:MAG: radical SAM protein, partial [Desulfosarcinaceae bacterium]
VTYRCQLRCDYCFARELQDEYADDMSRENFQRLLGWMRGRGLASAGFIGGEPTLHPLLPDMIEATAEAGILPVLFTNALFSEDLAHQLSRSVSNFVVNYNDPAFYTRRQQKRRDAALSRLFQAGARITFSKNFSPGNLARSKTFATSGESPPSSPAFVIHP